jgi:hypothetical protein
MRQRITVWAQPPLFNRVESIVPRGGSTGYTAEFIINAAFNLSDGTITMDEFLAAVRMGPSEKRAPKTEKPKPIRPPRKPPAPRKTVDPSVNPWDI